MSTQVDKKIHDLRSYLGLSLSDLGRATGYSGSHILRIEQKAVNPSEQFIQKVCEGLRVDPEYFTGEMPVDQAVQKVEVDAAGAGQRLSIARQEKGLSMLELSRESGTCHHKEAVYEGWYNECWYNECWYLSSLMIQDIGNLP